MISARADRWAVLAVVLATGCSATRANPAPPGVREAGGRALMVVGTIPLMGTDVVIHDAIRARGVEVDEVLETDVTPALAEHRRVVILSCSMASPKFKADLTAVKSPVIVLEHNLLPLLGMTAPAGHGFQNKLTAIDMTSTDPVLAAGLTGTVTVYQRIGEMFWGIPGPGAIKVATAQGNLERSFYFAYPAGATMVDRTAAGKRLHFFFAVHAPPPVSTLYLDDNGLKLLNAALDWSLN
jgi:hypothetical protein